MAPRSRVDDGRAMTSLLPRSTSARTRRPRAAARISGTVGRWSCWPRSAVRRPPSSVLVVCLALGVVGWFLTDAGAHGTPRDGLRVGALGLAAGPRLRRPVDGVAITAVPLGLTALCAWAVWRIGHRVGDSVSGHGPDADRIADGERDWTVPVAVGAVRGRVRRRGRRHHVRSPRTATTARLGQPGRLVVGAAVRAASAAPRSRSAPAGPRSGRRSCRRRCGRPAPPACGSWSPTSLVCGARVPRRAGGRPRRRGQRDVAAAHRRRGRDAVRAARPRRSCPTPWRSPGSYLLGPGFAVGAHTLVSPTVVVLGPLPLFPLLAALPANAAPAAWTAALMALPPRGRRGRGRPRPASAARRCAGTRARCAAAPAGSLAGVLFGLVASLAGGAVGPGRMRVVGPVLVRRAGARASPRSGSAAWSAGWR